MQAVSQKSWRASLGLVIAGLFMAGCTAAAQISPEVRLVQVADRMEKAQTAHFTAEGKVSGQPVPAEGAAPGGGETQQPLMASNFSAEGNIHFPNRQQVKVTIGDTNSSLTTEAVRVGNEVWVYDPMQRNWAKGTVNITDQIQQLDPLKTVGLLRVASQSLKSLGEENINGVKTTRLQAVLDPTRARELIIRGNPNLGANLEKIEGTIDLWVTDDNLLNQIRPDLAFTLIDPAQANSPRTRLVTDFILKFSNYDAPVTIEAPQVANSN